MAQTYFSKYEHKTVSQSQPLLCDRQLSVNLIVFRLSADRWHDVRHRRKAGYLFWCMTIIFRVTRQMSTNSCHNRCIIDLFTACHITHDGPYTATAKHDANRISHKDVPVSQGRNFLYFWSGTCHSNFKMCGTNAEMCHPNTPGAPALRRPLFSQWP